ncbi:phospholipase A [Pectobacteriaceae bacterium CE70]|uniref:Phospholipase A1 n=1 Tax=Serratia sp. (strain ATCC 39006) TaxID=104623 RepID=A0A2I5TFQ5_SERS3|nr:MULTISPECIES: phospholipase A [Enterobacterales]WJV58019.1 phospholipase A [Pectobacteriaceae bacterium C111]WJV62318.1 phospholipase A [Pectobacteriaceae bacterium C52]WJV66620.1 phospholipase A [Pectobacteriaceae bacterium CE70]WJY10621.1 phospholipase A [Pectobacteriaceae bacterium C80]AUG99076.1 phospholipase A [Serratia sp. ATCC 39006]
MRKRMGIVMGLLLAANAQAEEAKVQKIHDDPAVRGSIIAGLLQEHDSPFVLYPYESNYALYTYTSDINKQSIQSYKWANHARKDEVNFQISLGFPLWRGIAGDNSLLGASYTQRSWWQMSNKSESTPFRETNYEPQLFLGWAVDDTFAGWTLRDVEFGVNHQSNGRADPTSRSWNRVYARLMAQHNNWQVEVKPWIRLTDSDDDNPNIIHYMGHYRLRIGYVWGDSIFSAEGRYNWNSGYGGGDVSWSYPLTKHVRFYTKVFSGYGESLIDYNYRQTRFGIGIILNDML